MTKSNLNFDEIYFNHIEDQLYIPKKLPKNALSFLNDINNREELFNICKNHPGFANHIIVDQVVIKYNLQQFFHKELQEDRIIPDEAYYFIIENATLVNPEIMIIDQIPQKVLIKYYNSVCDELKQVLALKQSMYINLQPILLKANKLHINYLVSSMIRDFNTYPYNSSINEFGSHDTYSLLAQKHLSSYLTALDLHDLEKACASYIKGTTTSVAKKQRLSEITSNIIQNHPNYRTTVSLIIDHITNAGIDHD